MAPTMPRFGPSAAAAPPWYSDVDENWQGGVRAPVTAARVTEEIVNPICCPLCTEVTDPAPEEMMGTK